jgi:hypothetical protein
MDGARPRVSFAQAPPIHTGTTGTGRSVARAHAYVCAPLSRRWAMKRVAMLFASLVLFAVMGSSFAQDVKPYREGHVTEVSFIKIKPGQFNNYLKYLDGPYKTAMEASKKAGLITGYSVFESQARSPQDADVILTVDYPNMAALDRTDEADAIMAKVMGSLAAQDKAAMDRESMRELIGSQLIRELVLK